MSEETTDKSPKDDRSNKTQRKNDSNQSLLSIVHDKNKTIEKLQKQLHFQKLQLKYYLGKAFCNTKMREFSKTCTSQATEENLPVTLAVNRFYSQMGIKSKIIALYDRMCNIDGRISNLLQVQECFLRKFVGKVCDIARKENEIEVQFHFRNIAMNPEYMDMFNSLLTANIGLRKNLDTFRICCDRLIIIEEERNMIVEQVYSLPIEQRTNCNYLIGIQIEKVQLQNRMREILKDQAMLRNRIEELNIVEEQLRKMQEEYKATYQSSTEHVTGMLRKVNREALGLIAKSNQQREKYTKEIVELKGENLKISKLLERLKASINGKELNKDSLKLDAVYSAGLFQALDKEITQVIRENEQNKDSAVQKVRVECRALNQNLRDVQNQNILLVKEIDMVRTGYEEAKRQWARELETVQQERDEYKAQVEDLQAIRSAYAQLVESRGDVKDETEKLKQEEMDTQNDKKKLSELEQENVKLSLEVAELKEETSKQKSKIVRLSSIILNLNGNDQKGIGMVNLETKDAGSGDVQNENDVNLPRTNSCSLCKEKSELEKGIILGELQKSNVSTKDLAKLVETRQLDEITCNILQDLSNSSNECHCGSFSSQTQDSSTLEMCAEETQTVNFSPQKSLVGIEDIPLKCPKKNISTTFEIKTLYRDRKKDTLKGILERKHNVEGTVKMGDTSMLSVRLRCVSPKRKLKNTPKSSRTIIKTDESNEYELLKDCSLETIPHIVMPVKKATLYETHINLEELSYISKNTESKPIRVTYRNDYRTITTDSDPTTNESQSSEVENFSRVEAEEVKTRLKDLGGQLGPGETHTVAKFGIDGRVRSMSHLK